MSYIKKPQQNKLWNSSAVLYKGWGFQRSWRDTSVSPSFDGRWTRFPEMFWNIGQISLCLSFKGFWGQECVCIWLWVTPCANWCWLYSAKGLQVSHRIPVMGEEPHTVLHKAAALCNPIGFSPSPFPGIFMICISVGPREGPRPTRVVRWCHCTQVWRLQCGYDLGTPFPAHLAGGPRELRGGSAAAHAQPTTCPGLGEHSV